MTHVHEWSPPTYDARMDADTQTCACGAIRVRGGGPFPDEET